MVGNALVRRGFGWGGVLAVSFVAVAGASSRPVANPHIEGQVAGVTMERADGEVSDDGEATFLASANPPIVIVDPGGVGDVGMPVQFPDDRVSGFDIDAVSVVYDDVSDQLVVTIGVPGIVGDADGDGDPSATDPILTAIGGLDEVEFAGGEHFSLLIDVDQDSNFDVIAGVASGRDLTTYSVSTHPGGAFSFFPSFVGAYGDPLPQHNGGTPSAPTASSSNLSIVITDFSELAASLGIDDDSLDFGINVHTGSASDAGIGEDFIPSQGGAVQTELDARIGDLAWIDADLDGQQDASEDPAPGVTVDLIDEQGSVVDSTTTDFAGEYGFAARPGAYQIRFGLLDDHSFTAKGSGTQTDSDADLVTGFTSTFVVDQGDERLDLDVGLIHHEPSIDIEKSTNGEDADVGPGPTIATGAAVTFGYEVTNNGNIDLFDVVVVDDVLGDICMISSLFIGDFHRCEATSTATPGPYSNVGTATATPEINGLALDPVSDSDASHHTGSINPEIDIEKSTDGEDADVAPGATLQSGSTVAFGYLVTNTGNLALVDIDVVDDDFGLVCTIEYLNPGEHSTCGTTSVVEPGPYVNIGTATGTPVFGGTRYPDVADSDPSHHQGSIDPAISIEKATNGEDADVAPGPSLQSGSIVTFTYVVTNTGNVDLMNVAVGDDVLGPICTVDVLAPGDQHQCDATATVAPGPYANTGNVLGTPVLGGIEYEAVTDSDVSHHQGSLDPAIRVEKATNGEDADAAPGPDLVVGDAVVWTYTVTNAGNVPLTLVVVADDAEGRVCTIESLAPGAVEQCQIIGTVTEGQYSNLGNATAIPVFGGNSLLPVSDTDPSHYVGVVPGPACVPDIFGPLMWAGSIDRWDSGMIAQAGSTIIIASSEPDSSPGQPNEQVYVQVGGDIYGPTPVGLGQITIDVQNTGPVSVLHHSLVTGDTSNPNSVAFGFCGTDLS